MPASLPATTPAETLQGQQTLQKLRLAPFGPEGCRAYGIDGENRPQLAALRPKPKLAQLCNAALFNTEPAHGGFASYAPPLARPALPAGVVWPSVLRVRRAAELLGQQPFTGISHVDATCGRPDALY